MPGANERAMEKAKSLDCDAIIFDLEDAVAADAKAKAELLATAAGVRLGPLRRLSEGSGGGPVPLQMQRAALMEAAPVPIAAGEVDVRSTVTLVYDILP